MDRPHHHFPALADFEVHPQAARAEQVFGITDVFIFTVQAVQQQVGRVESEAGGLKQGARREDLQGKLEGFHFHPAEGTDFQVHLFNPGELIILGGRLNDLEDIGSNTCFVDNSPS